MLRQIALCLALFFASAAAAEAREQIRIVGSSTVYPFTSIAAEQFGQGEKFKTPIVESTGTGGGFKLFCSGVGEAYPDFNNASRAIKDSEVKLCAEHGVNNIIELPIGFDGIVFASARDGTSYSFTKKDIFKGLAREVPDKNGKLKLNSYKSWREINPALPDTPIVVYGPPPTSGTRDAFVELVMEHACDEFPAYAAAEPDKKIRQKKCGLLREDGGYIEAGEDDNLVIQKLTGNPDALGIVGFSFFEENQHRIQASKIDGITPTGKGIENGEYQVSRSLYVYMKGDHVGLVPGMIEFSRELLSDAAIGEEGYLTLSGLIPMPKEQHEAIKARLEAQAKPTSTP